MKRIGITLLSGLWLCGSLQAQDISINAQNFPDAAFRTHVSGYDLDHNGSLSLVEREVVTWMGNLSADVRDLTGVKFFTKLAVLNVNNTQLSSLDVSGCATLTQLAAENITTLKKLNVSGCSALTWLGLTGSPVEILDISGCVLLSQMALKGLTMSSLNASKCVALTYLGLEEGTSVETLDISGCISLGKFAIIAPTKSLNASGCTALTRLGLDGHLVDTLNVSGCVLLDTLAVDAPMKSLNAGGCTDLVALWLNQPVDVVNVSGCTGLTNLWWPEKGLKSLNVSGCTALEQLVCNDNDLTFLDVSGCTALKTLLGNRNRLTVVNVSGCTGLGQLNVGENKLPALDVSDCSSLYNLVCDHNELAALDITACEKLLWLTCNANRLTSLNTSRCPLLESLECGDNRLSSLDLSGNGALWEMWCYDNGLTALDISKNPNLTRLYCYRNQLTALDVSKNPYLTLLHCYRNQLTALDVSGHAALTSLNCDSNQLASLDIRNTAALETLDCSYNRLTRLDASGVGALQGVGCRNNGLPLSDLYPHAALARRVFSPQHIVWPDVFPGDTIDLRSEMYFGAGAGRHTTSVSFLTADGQPLSADLYTLGQGDGYGLVTFRQVGQYRFRLTNEAITDQTLSQPAEIHYEVTVSPATVAEPVFSPAEGAVKRHTSVTITCATAAAQIYYTTDGSEPNTSSTRYTGALTIDDSVTFKAYAVREGWEPSPVAVAKYTIIPDTVAEPTFSPVADAVRCGTEVKIECTTTGAVIYYTTDDTEPDPTDERQRYSTPVTVSDFVTIKAVAVKTDEKHWVASRAEAAYTIIPDTVKAPTFSQAAGAVKRDAPLSLATETEGARIYYTTDGTAPATSETKKLYTAWWAGERAQQVRALVTKPGDASEFHLGRPQ